MKKICDGHALLGKEPNFMDCKKCNKMNEEKTAALGKFFVRANTSYRWDLLMIACLGHKFNFSWVGGVDPCFVNKWSKFKKDTVIVFGAVDECDIERIYYDSINSSSLPEKEVPFDDAIDMLGGN